MSNWSTDVHSLLTLRKCDPHFLTWVSDKTVDRLNHLTINETDLELTQKCYHGNRPLNISEFLSWADTFPSKTELGEGKMGAMFAILWRESVWIEAR